jgi:DMSO/TMAO reductase YedYZ molybdopterin-dependent catalytic subunit
VNTGSRAGAVTVVETPRWMGAVAGVVAAGAALAAGQLPAAIAGEDVGPVTAMGNEFVDRYAASLKDLAVELFGRNDKVALVTGIVMTSLVLGGALGVLALRRFGWAAAGFVVFGAAGLWAQTTDPSSATGVALWCAAAGVAVAVGTLQLLLRRVVRPRTTTADEVSGRRLPSGDPTVKTADRRTFLATSGTVGAAAALTGLVGWSLRGRSTVEAQRRAVVLPEPVRATTPPTQGLITAEGISPYVTPNDDFYRIDTALITPQVDADSWRLQVGGLVDQPIEITYDELLGMEMVEEVVTIACVSNEVGGDLVGNASWLGVPLEELLGRAGLHPDATQVVGRSTDGFTVGFPTQVALDGRVAMVAVGMNGEPLPAAHGYPARLVVAGLYGYVSATKWLTEIELTRFEDFDAYWVPRGWSKQAPIKTQSRIDVPRAGAEVDAGPVTVGGVAWAPTVGIAEVEVSVDGGPWERAELGAVANDDTWVQWRFPWPAEPGEHRLRCRASDGDGDLQTADRAPPRPDGATGHHAVSVTVRA